jgi:hypothetical protein
MEFVRTVNRNYIESLLRIKGLTFQALGEILDPPLTQTAISKLLSPTHPYKDEGRLKQIAAVFNESDVLLFPFMPTEQKGNNKGKAD